MKIDWAAYYRSEGETKDHLPGKDGVEIHRCLAAWSVIPRRPVGSLLDAGCGNGYFCHWLGARKGLSRVVGIDFSPSRVEKAKRMFPEYEFGIGDVTNLPFRSGEFDVVTCIEVLEHLDDPAGVMKELARVSGKYVVVTVPDRQPVRMVLCPHCGKHFPQYGHLQTFDRKRLIRMAEEAGCEVETIKSYRAPRGASLGLPHWVGFLAASALNAVRPRPATFLAMRAAVRG